ncbi:3-keto-disaccharide hydrolase [Fibrella aquatica]|uniref:3-keto-disaccharide hydrolase n=1 Tax=Fibrella aquatica TaxID=3242487 RepID=UPI003520E84A
MTNSINYLVASLFAITLSASAQQTEIPSQIIDLQNLSAFKPTGSNWKVAGDVFYDLNTAGKGNTKSGTGILVNTLSAKGNQNLFTTMEHGDVQLELDFMMEKGSNAGIYLQGRYEVQLFDSWGVKNPKSSDCGAIYERWDESRPEGRKGYEGHPPAQNVSKAPGLWQHLSITFRAPRFNSAGQKIANARFLKVTQNGVVVQENVEVTGPTRAAAFTDEKPTGPLMIQGDHGAVAIRNIRYKAYGIEPMTLTDMKLKAYEGRFKSIDDMESMTAKRDMTIDVLAHMAPGSRDKFGGVITGTIHIPRTGQYLISLNLDWIPAETNANNPNGEGQLTIANKPVFAISGKNGGTTSAMVTLEAGDHPLKLAYYKNFGLWYARSNDITLSLEGPGVQYTTLNPVIVAQDPVGEISLIAKGEPVMQRGFVNYKGAKRTHTISVGEPGEANYSFDLSKGEFLQIWRGDFLETTPMWYGRGETQLSVPLGSVIEMAGKPSITFLADQNAAWPDSNAVYRNQGYDLDKNGRPVFKYMLGTANVRESFVTQDEGRRLAHTFTVGMGQEKGQLWCRVAEGSSIAQLANGLYAVNDKQYFIELPTGEKPVVRTTPQRTQELLIPVKATGATGTATYSIIW